MIDFSLDYILAYHCAPTLLGCKPANLVSFKKNVDIVSELEKLNEFSKNSNIFFEFISSCSNRYLVLVYNKNLLDETISSKKNKDFLLSKNYPMNSSLSSILNHLKNTIIKSKDFPHEIGIFLGYPLYDILGFLKNKGKNYKICGYWKVYSDEEYAKMLFDKFNYCREVAVNHIKNGNPILFLLKNKEAFI